MPNREFTFADFDEIIRWRAFFDQHKIFSNKQALAFVEFMKLINPKVAVYSNSGHIPIIGPRGDLQNLYKHYSSNLSRIEQVSQRSNNHWPYSMQRATDNMAVMEKMLQKLSDKDNQGLSSIDVLFSVHLRRVYKLSLRSISCVFADKDSQKAKDCYHQFQNQINSMSTLNSTYEMEQYMKLLISMRSLSISLSFIYEARSAHLNDIEKKTLNVSSCHERCWMFYRAYAYYTYMHNAQIIPQQYVQHTLHELTQLASSLLMEPLDVPNNYLLEVKMVQLLSDRIFERLNKWLTNNINLSAHACLNSLNDLLLEISPYVSDNYKSEVESLCGTVSTGASTAITASSRTTPCSSPTPNQ